MGAKNELEIAPEINCEIEYEIKYGERNIPESKNQMEPLYMLDSVTTIYRNTNIMIFDGTISILRFFSARTERHSLQE